MCARKDVAHTFNDDEFRVSHHVDAAHIQDTFNIDFITPLANNVYA